MDIEGGHFKQPWKYNGVMEIWDWTERQFSVAEGHSYGGRRPPGREASVPAPQGPRKVGARSAPGFLVYLNLKDRIQGFLLFFFLSIFGPNNFGSV